jgi:hypothetical protein
MTGGDEPCCTYVPFLAIPPLEDTPAGRLLEGIIEVIDEFYSANLSQDVLRGMKENAGRGFLKSFVERIDVGDSQVKMYYTVPMPPSSLPEETVGVIPFVHHGQRRGGQGGEVN